MQDIFCWNLLGYVFWIYTHINVASIPKTAKLSIVFFLRDPGAAAHCGTQETWSSEIWVWVEGLKRPCHLARQRWWCKWPGSLDHLGLFVICLSGEFTHARYMQDISIYIYNYSYIYSYIYSIVIYIVIYILYIYTALRLVMWYDLATLVIFRWKTNAFSCDSEAWRLGGGILGGWEGEHPSHDVFIGDFWNYPRMSQCWILVGEFWSGW